MCPHLVECVLVNFPTELNDLHRERGSLPQPAYDLGLIRDDDHTESGLGHHFLAKQRTTQALDEVDGGIDLVGTIDGEVQNRVGGQRSQRNSQIPAAIRSPQGGRDAHDLLQTTHTKVLGETHQEVGYGAPGTQAEDHTLAHFIEGAKGSGPLERSRLGHGLLPVRVRVD